MGKSPDAFRTISEVADWLGIQAHVLRFWESKFTQVKPIKRAGGRRYYRPADMQLLGGIQKLLHEDGLTIKGVQKILREEGMSHVAALSPALDELTLSQIDDAQEAEPEVVPAPDLPEKGVVLNFDPPAEKVKETPQPIETEVKSDSEGTTQDVTAQPETPPAPIPEEEKAPEAEVAPAEETVEPEPKLEVREEQPAPEKQVSEAPPQSEDAPAALPAFLRRPVLDDAAQTETTDSAPAAAHPPEPEPVTRTETPAAAPQVEVEAAPEPEPPETPSVPKPRVIDLPPFLKEDDIAARPAVLSAAYRTKNIDAAAAKDAAPLLQKLSALRDSMSAQRRGGNSPAPKD